MYMYVKVTTWLLVKVNILYWHQPYGIISRKRSIKIFVHRPKKPFIFIIIQRTHTFVICSKEVKKKTLPLVSLATMSLIVLCQHNQVHTPQEQKIIITRGHCLQNIYCTETFVVHLKDNNTPSTQKACRRCLRYR